MLSAYSTEMGQNEALYTAFKQIQQSAEFTTLDKAQQKIIDNALRDFRLSGVELPQEKKLRYKEIMQQLSNINSKFDQNILDATHGWIKHIEDETLLSGLPDSVKSLARQNAEQKEMSGWVLTLDFPSYYPTMLYADDRQLREEMYTAFGTNGI